MKSTTDRLYNLLPAIYRQRDAENGRALHALMRVMAQELRVVEADMETLYDNWFVDTCQEWVLPYIGELLGVRDLLDEKSVITSQRRRIANTIRYRRRKGIGAVLENVVYDVTGWRTRLVEFFDHVSMTQSISNLRKGKCAILDIRNKLALEQLEGPFDSGAHLIDMRSIGNDKSSSCGKRGKYNISNIGLFLWRLQSYSASGSTAVPCSEAPGCFFFNSMGFNTPLFNKPQPNTDLTSISQVQNLPVALTRSFLEKDLNQYKKEQSTTIESKPPLNSIFYGPNRSLNIVVKGNWLSPMQVISTDLSKWEKDILDKKEIIDGNEISPCAAVDVELGRLAFSDAFLKENVVKNIDVIVNYHYGFSTDMGGGPYDRSSDQADISSATLLIEVAKGTESATLQKAFIRWNDHCQKSSSDTPITGVIRIMDNAVYGGNIAVKLPQNSHLAIEASDGKNPCVRPFANMSISGPEQKNTVASLVINGIRLNKPILIKGGVNLKVLHSTIMPPGSKLMPRAGIIADASAHDIRIDISHSITGPIHVPADAASSLVIRDSIVDDNFTGMAIGQDKFSDRYGPSSVLERVTVFGQARVRELIASETIFSGTVTAERRQIGYIRFSYAPPDSLLPIKYRCQPDADKSSTVQPHFTSVRYENPGYAQLSHICPDAILKGAKDGSEMGAFKSLRQSQREEGLKNVIHEYLRQDMEAGFFYVT